MEDANRTVRQIEEANNKKTAIMNRYAANTGGTQSDALAAARMAKAIAPRPWNGGLPSNSSLMVPKA